MNHFIKLILAFLVIGSLYSFKNKEPKKYLKVFNNPTKWIPSDFDVRKGTFLIENFKLYNSKGVQLKTKSLLAVNENMKEFMKTNYPFSYEFVDEKDLKDSKYEDLDKYRYLFKFDNGTESHLTDLGSKNINLNDFNNGSKSYSSSNIGSTSMSVSTNDFHIYDRKLNKHNSTTMKASSYALPVFKPAINTIVAFLKGLK